MNKHEWIFVSTNPNHSPFDGSPENIYMCSKCGHKTGVRTPFCPMCGDKKTKGENNKDKL